MLQKIDTVLSSKYKPLLYGLAAGLYPVFFYYSHNYALVSSTKQILFFSIVFIGVPAIGFWIASLLFNLSFLEKYKKYLLVFLNIWVFLTLIRVCLYADSQIIYLLIFGIIALVATVFLHKHGSKVVIFQFILALLGLFTLIPTIIRQQSFSEQWKKQPDDIASVVFKKKPNVYFIQPDGYVNPSELKRGYYKLDNSYFENYLIQKGFTLYPNFRTNYASTLSTNSSVFMMKHHYYNKALKDEEGMDARSVIISDNTTLNAFKNNGYKTYFLSQGAYFFINFPKLGYDYSNFSTKDIKLISQGIEERKDFFPDLKKIVTQDTAKNKFVFMRIYNPRHIRSIARGAKDVKKEKESWIENLHNGNKELIKIIDLITKNDPDALIIIMADHGGYVGFNNTDETLIKTNDRDKIYSIFSSLFSVKSKDSLLTKKFKTLKTPVNLFRILFSHLSENKNYLNHLQDDGSYIIIYKGAPKGIYKYIDDNGTIVFERKD